jgi:hypothetical protein
MERDLTCLVPPLQGSGGFILGKVSHRLCGGLSSVARLWRSVEAWRAKAHRQNDAPLGKSKSAPLESKGCGTRNKRNVQFGTVPVDTYA